MHGHTSSNCEAESCRRSPVRPTWVEQLDGLARRAQAGDRACLEQLAQTIRPRFVRLARYRLGCPEPDDMANDAWLQVQKGLGGYKPEKPFWPWAKVILLNVARRDMQTRRTLADQAGSEMIEGADEALREHLDRLRTTRPNPMAVLVACHEQFNAIWAELWKTGGYPHQQLSFGYSKIVHGKPSLGRRALEGKAAVVSRNHADSQLEAVRRDLIHDFLAAAGVSAGSDLAGELEASMAPMDAAMRRRFKEILLPNDSPSAYPPSLLESTTGMTAMREYAPKGKLTAGVVSNWNRKVWQRIQRALATELTPKASPTDQQSKPQEDDLRPE